MQGEKPHEPHRIKHLTRISTRNQGELRANLTSELARVACPVLLLHPDSSPFIPVPVMAALQRALPNARLQVFAHARHGLPFSHTAECAAAVAHFLDRHTPQPA